MNGTDTSSESFISPACKEDLPEIYLPGHAKFTSYRNSLESYCYKKKYAEPEYRIIDENSGLIGAVTFASSFVRSTEVSPNAKEAYSYAAFEALKLLGYLLDATFQKKPRIKTGGTSVIRKQRVIQSLKQKYMDKIENIESGTPDNENFRQLLRRYAEQRKLPLPSYNTVTCNNTFFSTVTFDDETYKGMTQFQRQKDAEESAARVALTDLFSGPSVINGMDIPTESFISPSAQTDLPSLYSLGDTQFSCYQNALEEYCFKKIYAAPQYAVISENNGKIGAVSFDSCFVRSTEAVATFKEACLLAAFEALKLLGYLGEEHEYKTQDQLIADIAIAIQKQQKIQSINKIFAEKVNELESGGIDSGENYRKIFNHYSGRRKLPPPTYNTVTVNNTFFSTVTFDGQSYKGMAQFPKRKDAEDSAAQVALTELLKEPPEEGNNGYLGTKVSEQMDTSQSFTEERKRKQTPMTREMKLVSKILKIGVSDPTLFKDHLREYANNKKLLVPTYETVAVTGGYNSTVTFDGINYKAVNICTKKAAAEQSAAHVALNALFGIPLAFKQH